MHRITDYAPGKPTKPTFRRFFGHSQLSFPAPTGVSLQSAEIALSVRLNVDFESDPTTAGVALAITHIPVWPGEKARNMGRLLNGRPVGWTPSINCLDFRLVNANNERVRPNVR
jgi:hypothetical protein